MYRDLKPDNILLLGVDSADIRSKIIDFGMAKSTGKKKVNLNTYCGTIDFMAPEIFAENGYDEKCDLWSIGVIAFFMLSGLPPFFAKNE